MNYFKISFPVLWKVGDALFGCDSPWIFCRFLELSVSSTILPTYNLVCFGIIFHSRFFLLPFELLFSSLYSWFWFHHATKLTCSSRDATAFTFIFIRFFFIFYLLFPFICKCFLLFLWRSIITCNLFSFITGTTLQNPPEIEKKPPALEDLMRENLAVSTKMLDLLIEEKRKEKSRWCTILWFFLILAETGGA